MCFGNSVILNFFLKYTTSHGSLVASLKEKDDISVMDVPVPALNGLNINRTIAEL
jgi:hypothetical protein